MSISKEQIHSYRLKNKELQRRLNVLGQPEGFTFEAKEIMNAYKDELQELLPIKTLEKEGYDINQDNTLFPLLNSQFLTYHQLELIKKIYGNKLKYKETLTLQSEKFPLLKELERSFDYVVQHQGNWLKMLFVSKDIKMELDRKIFFINQNIWQQDEIERQINIIVDKPIDADQARADFEANKEAYYDTIAQSLNYDTKEPDQLTRHIEQQIKEVEDRISDIDIEALEASIKSAWQTRKEAMSQEKLNKLPLTYLNSVGNLSIKQEVLRDLKIQTIGDLKEYMQKIKRVDFDNDSREKDEELVQTFSEKYYEDFYPKINASALRKSDLDFLQLVKKRMEVTDEYNDQLEKIKQHIKESRDLIHELNSVGLNDYQAAVSDEASNQQVKLHKQNLAKTYENIIPLKEYLPTQFNYSDGLLETDFKRNSANYYAIIDQIIGGNRNRATDLPGFIVEQVEKIKVNTDDFYATLRPYQLFGVQYALNFKKTLLGDEMGLGKTVQAIAVANHLYHLDKKHTVAVMPLSVLANWNREIKKWSKLPVHIFRNAGRNQAFDDWKREGGILAMNYEQTKHLLPKLEFYKIAPDFVIVDEAHMIKNPDAQRSKNTNQVAEMAEYNLFLTGTALENRLDEMKQLISVLNPDLARSFELKPASYDSEAFKEEVSIVYLRRKRDEVLRELPEIETIEMWSRLSKTEQEYYDEAVRIGLPGLMKMRRAAFYGKSARESEKIQQIIDICKEAKENGDKIIIFSFFKIVLNELKHHIGDNLVGMIYGGVSASERQALIDEFADAPDGAILLSQIDSGGVGLNIQAANVVILCEPQWKPSTEKQAIGRVYRMGQTKNVNVYRLLSEETVEETILRVLRQKEDIFNIYAHDSAVSDAFDSKQAASAEESELSGKDLEKKIFEIEVERLKRKEEIA